MIATDDGRRLLEAMEACAPQIIRVLHGMFPRDLNFRLTATQKRGKMRLEFNGLYHEVGWTDTSG